MNFVVFVINGYFELWDLGKLVNLHERTMYGHTLDILILVHRYGRTDIDTTRVNFFIFNGNALKRKGVGKDTIIILFMH